MQSVFYRYQLLHGELNDQPYYGVYDSELEIVIAEDFNIEKMLDFIEQREIDDRMLVWK